ncbi:hypothetical protein [Ancylobacter defluvii]|uniref:Uncharacterized protein n=1 Tax=Ancylobacter defluvii TaxID=1282440 RepID=A0A9W6ND90_9HYPH|nr:hypothetical protein [Ancylobacter defluvii]MBS7588257.1 hypothetical protein [Ancylobacter defluvii]GLK86653.1 hypothetical protein GCM10017653_47230 [Ancylobacter defluvii]
MEIETKAHLRALAETYSAIRKASLTSVMKEAASDGSLLTNLDQGRTITLRRVDEIRQWFSDRWPDDVPWPDSSWPRPEPRELAEGSAA